ncbi:MAG: PIN domain-containing protein [Candidatus Diapherotrites archaeon]|nr:PIN domain-containing protein [Candidatus Diapherotrites archaeon]
MPELKLVVDANVIVSALLKNGQTRELLLSGKFEKLAVPDFIQEELFKYLDEFSKRLDCEKKELQDTLAELFESAKIEIFQSEFYSDFSTKAKSLISDSKDTAYLALALKLNYSIWSQDPDFKAQNEIKIYTTLDLIKLISI